MDEAFTGFFRTFPQNKKSAGLGPHSGSELGADFNPWTLAAYVGSMVLEEDELEMESEYGVGAGGGRRDSLRRWVLASAGMHAVLGAPHGSASTGCASGFRCTFAHSWAELHPEASAQEHELASYLPD